MTKAIKIIFAVLAVILLAGCSGGGATEPAPAETPSTNETQFHGPLDPYQSDSPEPVLLTDFKQPYAYEDGVEFRIVKIETGHLTAKQAHEENEYWSKTVAKPGDGWVLISTQTKNGTAKVESGISPDITYGPNGETARTGESGAVKDTEWVDVKILPKRQKTGWEVHYIPEKYWDDVTIQVVRGPEFPDLIYTGSVKP
jgi:hypothetical protein